MTQGLAAVPAEQALLYFQGIHAAVRQSCGKQPGSSARAAALQGSHALHDRTSSSSLLLLDLLCLCRRSQVLEQSLAWLRSESVVHSEAAATALAAVALLQELPSSQVCPASPCHHCHILSMLSMCCAGAVQE